MFKVPVKEIIVNADSQVVAYNSDGSTAYANGHLAPGSNTGALILDGFHNNPIWSTATAAATSNNQSGKGSYFKLLSSATRIIKTTGTAGVAEVAAWTIATSGTAKAGDTYRVVTDTIDLTPVQYQNRPNEKRYQLSVDCANAAAIVAELVKQINADPKAQVTALAGRSNATTPTQDDSNKIILTAKTAGASVGLYVGQYSVVGQSSYLVTATKVALTYGTLPTGGTNAGVVYHTSEDTYATLALPALPKGTYDALKNINWAKNFNIDQNINWMPLPGTTYNAYYFEVVSQNLTLTAANTPYPNEGHANQEYGIRLYVKSSLALDTALSNATNNANV